MSRKQQCRFVLPGFAALFLLLAVMGTAGAVKTDVPYVPTPENVVDTMIEMADVQESDLVYDLGCGDGRIVITAARERGARGIGIDIDPQRIEESLVNAEQAGVNDRVEFAVQDLFETDFSDATVVMLYLLPAVNLELRPKLLSDLRPGSRVVSHDFDMGEWEADEHANVDWSSDVFYWVVPANVSGIWRLEDGEQEYELEMEQEFQKVTGALTESYRTSPLRDVVVNGDRIEFVLDGPAGEVNYRGRVDGDRIQGEDREWTAVRKEGSESPIDPSEQRTWF
ncbi:MAG: SAM-dependent methyltransferase [Desulfovibrionales bacterium]